MAIPFNVPIVEQSETVLELLLVDLFEILQQIQTLQHSRAQNQIATISPRAACATPRRTRTHDVTIVPTTTATTTNTLNNARAELDPVMLPTVPTPSSTTTTTTRARCCRRRTISASTSSTDSPSYCEEIKSVVVMTDVEPRNQDWTQVGVILRKIADDFQPTTSKDQDRDQVDCKDCGSSSSSSSSSTGGESRSLLSKLVPRPIRSSLWTAVICVVGWHLFRAQ